MDNTSSQPTTPSSPPGDALAWSAAATAPRYYAVKEIWQKDARSLGIVWTDGVESSYDVVALRRQCPCALCIDEMTGKKKLRDDDVDESVRPLTIKSVGRYALTIAFSDGHNTGIYSFDVLRRLGASPTTADSSNLQ